MAGRKRDSRRSRDSSNNGGGTQGKDEDVSSSSWLGASAQVLRHCSLCTCTCTCSRTWTCCCDHHSRQPCAWDRLPPPAAPQGGPASSPRHCRQCARAVGDAERLTWMSQPILTAVPVPVPVPSVSAVQPERQQAVLGQECGAVQQGVMMRLFITDSGMVGASTCMTT